MSAAWTQKELAAMQVRFPEYVGRAPDGALYGQLSRDEVRVLVSRMPTMFTAPIDLPVNLSPNDRAWMARYPSLYGGTPKNSGRK